MNNHTLRSSSTTTTAAKARQKSNDNKTTKLDKKLAECINKMTLIDFKDLHFILMGTPIESNVEEVATVKFLPIIL